MRRPDRAHSRWWLVVAFAMAMAWVEAACVYYLRVMVDRIEPYQQNPLPFQGVLGQVELAREAATLIMLFSLGRLAGRTREARWGYTAVAFGVWDIFYYVFLRLMGDWPKSLFDWDILFLLPLPWWGPVLAPVSIAVLMIVGGTLATRSPSTHHGGAARYPLGRLLAPGIGLALYVFMANALRALGHGQNVTTTLPEAFNWPLFGVAFALMAAPVVQAGWQKTPRVVSTRSAEERLPES